jgi:ABC-2 type transport system ATP-binding protein
MISVKHLSKIYSIPKKEKGWAGLLKNIFQRQYKKIIALNQASFTVGENELVGLIGPNGAGKTTAMKILSGILYPTSGDISVLGFNPFEKKAQFLKQITFIMGQRNQLLWELPAYDSFMLNKEIYEINDQQFKKTLDKLTLLLDCQNLINQPIKTLSLGERMRMELIASLLHRPKVLFLDEPTIGLDVIAQKIIRDFIKDYQRIFQATVILTSHYMEDVRQLAKRVMIINEGKIIYDGLLEEIVNKYAKEKIITVILENPVDLKQLAKFSDIYHISFPKVVFKVKKGELAKKVEFISRSLPFVDITIEEEKIEDVIRKIFQSKKT